MLERASEWKLTKNVFKQIVKKVGLICLDLEQIINYQVIYPGGQILGSTLLLHFLQTEQKPIITVFHPLIMTTSLKNLYLSRHRKITHPLHPNLRLLLGHISGEILSHKMFQQHNTFSCPVGENPPEKDIPVLQLWHDFSLRDNKPIVCYQI